METLKEAAKIPPSAGPIDVDDSIPAVDQLWDQVNGVINACNAWINPFLKKFGIEEGNGLCPLVLGNYKTPKDLNNFVVEFFKTAAKDHCDYQQMESSEDNEQPVDDDEVLFLQPLAHLLILK